MINAKTLRLLQRLDLAHFACLRTQPQHEARPFWQAQYPIGHRGMLWYGIAAVAKPARSKIAGRELRETEYAREAADRYLEQADRISSQSLALSDAGEHPTKVATYRLLRRKAPLLGALAVDADLWPLLDGYDLHAADGTNGPIYCYGKALGNLEAIVMCCQVDGVDPNGSEA